MIENVLFNKINYTVKSGDPMWDGKEWLGIKWERNFEYYDRTLNTLLSQTLRAMLIESPTWFATIDQSYLLKTNREKQKQIMDEWTEEMSIDRIKKLDGIFEDSWDSILKEMKKIDNDFSDGWIHLIARCYCRKHGVANVIDLFKGSKEIEPEIMCANCGGSFIVDLIYTTAPPKVMCPVCGIMITLEIPERQPITKDKP